MTTRPARKAGEWYKAEPADLSQNLDAYLNTVPDTVNGIPLPIPGARIVVAPHAGYDWSGETAAWAYKSLDLSKAKRVFILGPSHTTWFQGCRVTTFSKYATPFGDFVVDRDIIQRLAEAGEMEDMDPKYDVAEHSLELHLPYLYKRCEQTFENPSEFPKVVPIVVGNTSREDEKDVGRLLLSYVKDPENAFIISSDFCHWGRRFEYTVYTTGTDIQNLTHLRSSGPRPSGPPIYQTIQLVDDTAMEAMQSGSHDAFIDNLKVTKNSVCGRHPIGIALAALELYAKENNAQGNSRFIVVKYDRSGQVELPDDSSVSYVSAYAVL